MCGRFASAMTSEELMRRFDITIKENIRPRWNVAPSQNATVICRDGQQTIAISATWGQPITSVNKTMLINARMETAKEKPTFSSAFVRSRCIVVASGWYEWSAPKTPWHIHLRDGGVIAMAGLLLRRGVKSRFVIITSAADGKLAKFTTVNRLYWALVMKKNGLVAQLTKLAHYAKLRLLVGSTGTVFLLM